MEESQILNSHLQRERDCYQKKYDDLAKLYASKPITNNNTQNIVNLTIFSKSDEDINKVVDDKYDKYYLQDGQKGVAQFTKRHLVNTDPKAPLEYIVTDRSRFHGKFMGENNESIPDTNMQGLTSKIYPSINKKAAKIMKDEKNVFENNNLMNGYIEVREMIHDNRTFCKNFTKLHNVHKIPVRNLAILV